MTANSKITLTKEDFLKLAKLGLVVEKDSITFYYDPEFNHSFDSPKHIPGYVLSEDGEHPEPINRYWRYFEDRYPFTVIHPPALHISKPKALGS